MKKNKILIITLVLGILFLTSYLYGSYATSTGVSLGNDENTYDILLNDSTDTVSVPAKSSKTIYYQFSNTNKGTVKYHIGYSSDNVIAKVWWDTEDKISDTIEQGEYKFIKLKLINDSTSDDTITIKPVLGYVNGGDVIPDSNTTLVTGTINETNTWNKSFPVSVSKIKEIYFVNDNIVPNDALGSKNGNNDGSITTWYTVSDTEEMYNVYIGSNNGITTFPSNSSNMFDYASNLVLINFKNTDSSNVTNMMSMFRYCSKLSDVNFDYLDTSNVEIMSYMFYGTKLSQINIDTSNCRNMSYMFMQSKATSLNLSSFDTSSVTNMSNMFNGMRNITSLNLSNFDTSSVTNMYRMFYNTTIRQLDIGVFTLGATNVSEMFSANSYLSLIDMRNADFTNTINNSAIFGSTPTTVNIYLKDTQGNRDFMSNNFSNYTNVQYIPSS